MSLGAVTRTFAHDAAEQLTTMTDAPSGGVTTFTHDLNGNRTRQSSSNGSARTYQYDQANRLTGFQGAPLATVNPPGTNGAVRYPYTGDGLRSDLIWDRSGSLPLIIGDRTGTAYVTGPGGLPLERIDAAGNVLHYHHDQLGSTRVLTNDRGAPVTTYTYDAYGNAAVSNTSVVNPFQFAGQYVDAATGLIYMRARWYDPTTGRFISRDPIVSVTQSPYAYVDGNPLNSRDPSGLIGLRDVSNFFAGFGDSATGGLTHMVRGWMGGNDAVDPCSGAYRFGEASGIAYTTAMSFAGGAGGAAGFADDAAGFADDAARVGDDFVVVRGGVSDVPPPGQMFSGAAGRTLDDAAAGVPHNQIRTTTPGEIRSAGGTVEHAPELTRSGVLNEKHVNTCLGPGQCPFGELQPNPVPPSGRIR